jgi:uncharacterized SAM-binding protein YcdF (DUF218 family)
VARIRSLLRSRRLRRIVLFIIGVWLLFALCLCGAIFVYGSTDYAQSADVIIVLGAGLHDDNSPSEVFWGRTERASELWDRGLAPIIICTGGLPGRATRTEASVCSELLQQRGVPGDIIILEEHSRSTEENALESRIIMDANGWHTAIVVSDGFHLMRASWLFGQAGIESYTSPVPFSAVNPLRLVVAIGREVAAFHWQVLKQVFNLEFTYVPLI